MSQPSAVQDFCFFCFSATPTVALAAHVTFSGPHPAPFRKQPSRAFTRLSSGVLPSGTRPAFHSQYWKQKKGFPPLTAHSLHEAVQAEEPSVFSSLLLPCLLLDCEHQILAVAGTKESQHFPQL